MPVVVLLLVDVGGGGGGGVIILFTCFFAGLVNICASAARMVNRKNVARNNTFFMIFFLEFKC